MSRLYTCAACKGTFDDAQDHGRLPSVCLECRAKRKPERTYTCEACGLTFPHPTGRLPRLCPEDRGVHIATPRLNRNANPELATTGYALAASATRERLAIEQALHSLNLAVHADYLGWDWKSHVDAAIDHLSDAALHRDDDLWAMADALARAHPLIPLPRAEVP